MNYRYSLQIVGRIMTVTAGLILLPALVSVIYGDGNVHCFIITALILLALGMLSTLIKATDKNIYAREGFLIVALSWVVISLFGALPYVLSGEIPSYIDAYFETVSGFTTTGATILTDVESMSHSMLFWRSFTNWIGGMGVLVFAFAILSQSGTRIVHIIRAEAPGPGFGKLVSKTKINLQILYGIYIALSVIEFILLVCGGMPVFDAVVNTFGTAGTGGFAIKNASIAANNSAYVDYVVGIFMVLFGINFNLYFLLLMLRLGDVFRSEELRWYFGIIVFSTVTIAANIYPIYKTVGDSMRYAFFQVVSFISTTGYTATDYNHWPAYSHTVLITLFFIGACVGSTGCGFKVMRVIIMLKTAFKEIRFSLNPRSVSTIMFDKKPVDRSVVTGVGSYVIAFTIIFFASVLIVSAGGLDFASNTTAVLVCLNNLGIGVAGAQTNFPSMSVLSKLVLCFDMLVGRLEIFPMLILFTPAAWRK
jgi:trk system potassium uptake protein TrkH